MKIAADAASLHQENIVFVPAIVTRRSELLINAVGVVLHNPLHMDHLDNLTTILIIPMVLLSRAQVIHHGPLLLVRLLTTRLSSITHPAASMAGNQGIHKLWIR